MTAPGPGQVLRSLVRAPASGWVGVVVELTVVGVALVANLVVRWLTLDDVAIAVDHAHDVLVLERAWQLDWEHEAQEALAAVPWLRTFGAWFYVWGYLPIVLLALVALFVARPPLYARLRNALLAGGVVGLPFYVLYPLAPPRLSGLGYADALSTSAVEAAARPAGIANEIAAMPSFHVGYLLIVAVVVSRATDLLLARIACFVVPLLMGWVVVATGNHWVVDLPAGAVLAVLGLGAAHALERWSR